MSEQKSSKSLTNEILETLFASLEGQAGFDADLIEQLRDLARRQGMSNARKVSEVLKQAREASHENP